MRNLPNYAGLKIHTSPAVFMGPQARLADGKYVSKKKASP